MTANESRILRLQKERALSKADWVALISTHTPEEQAFAAKLARETAERRFGKNVYFRGIVEYSNICKNDCYYCGIRKSNLCVSRYRLTEEEILESCREGYAIGYRTFVLQGGEDGWWTDDKMVPLVKRIRTEFPDCAITLSLGERSEESYRALYEAGADRYLLRHETATPEHYSLLHPDMRLETRMDCLRSLRRIGYQTGAGMMVGTPGQTAEHLAADMLFLSEFKPEMVGIGPFLPHKDTPFRDEAPGSAEMTLFLLALTRLMLPDALIPATTALGTLQGDGRKNGVLHGCNVVMPNLSPMAVRKKYMLYNEKAGIGLTARESLDLLTRQMEEIGYTVLRSRGDFQRRDDI